MQRSIPQPTMIPGEILGNIIYQHIASEYCLFTFQFNTNNHMFDTFFLPFVYGRPDRQNVKDVIENGFDNMSQGEPQTKKQKTKDVHISEGGSSSSKPDVDMSKGGSSSSLAKPKDVQFSPSKTEEKHKSKKTSKKEDSKKEKVAKNAMEKKTKKVKTKGK